MPKTIRFGSVELARSCTYCGGDGVVEIYRARTDGKEATGEDDEYMAVECGECDGVGGHMTEEGQAILDLVQAYGRKRV